MDWSETERRILLIGIMKTRNQDKCLQEMLKGN